MSQVFTASPAAQTAGGATASVLLGSIASVGGTNNFFKKATVAAPLGYTTVTANASNNVVISVGYRRAGGSRTVIATFTTTVTSIAALSSIDIPVSLSNAARSQLLPGDVLDVTLTQAGTGVAVGAGLVVTAEID